ncbi:MAG TPA: hypothetical protein VNS58_08730 [Puia sp.]|nr:hypothetical protein [Puia sp.]
MKKHFSKMAFLAILAVVTTVGFSSTASAQVYVSVRPVFAGPRVRPAPPSPRHVWIDEEWTMRGGRYVSTGGYWAAPPHPGWAWVPGRWAHERRGDYWIAGRWRRR